MTPSFLEHALCSAFPSAVGRIHGQDMLGWKVIGMTDRGRSDEKKKLARQPRLDLGWLGRAAFLIPAPAPAARKAPGGRCSTCIVAVTVGAAGRMYCSADDRHKAPGCAVASGSLRKRRATLQPDIITGTGSDRMAGSCCHVDRCRADPRLRVASDIGLEFGAFGTHYWDNRPGTGNRSPFGAVTRIARTKGEISSHRLLFCIAPSGPRATSPPGSLPAETLVVCGCRTSIDMQTNFVRGTAAAGEDRCNM